MCGTTAVYRPVTLNLRISCRCYPCELCAAVCEQYVTLLRTSDSFKCISVTQVRKHLTKKKKKVIRVVVNVVIIFLAP